MCSRDCHLPRHISETYIAEMVLGRLDVSWFPVSCCYFINKTCSGPKAPKKCSGTSGDHHRPTTDHVRLILTKNHLTPKKHNICICNYVHIYIYIYFLFSLYT